MPVLDHKGQRVWYPEGTDHAEVMRALSEAESEPEQSADVDESLFEFEKAQEPDDQWQRKLLESLANRPEPEQARRVEAMTIVRDKKGLIAEIKLVYES